jgi:hypothetical protein
MVSEPPVSTVDAGEVATVQPGGRAEMVTALMVIESEPSPGPAVRVHPIALVPVRVTDNAPVGEQIIPMSPAPTDGLGLGDGDGLRDGLGDELSDGLGEGLGELAPQYANSAGWYRLEESTNVT